MVELIPQQSEQSSHATRTIQVPIGQKMVIHDIAQSFSATQTTEIFVEDQAELVLIYEQDETGIFHESHIERRYRLVLGRDAQATVFFFTQGGARCSLFYEMCLENEGASVQLYGLYFLKDKRTVDISLRQQHCAPNTKSEVLVKGVVFDEAKSVFNGTIGIDAYAKNSNATLYNKNILMSEKACAISKPCLEVLADAVQCKHGSAVGSFDAEHLFYLRSRGLSEGRAKKELLQAFVQEIIHSISDLKIKNHWQEKTQIFMGEE